jgi:hypothetical protein
MAEPTTIVCYNAEVMATIVSQFIREGIVMEISNVNNTDDCWEIKLTGGH